MDGIPEVVGPYAIDREIGRGGMGVVYHGVDTRLGREVAVKALPPEVAGDPQRLARFEREARTLATLSHPNVAGIYGVEQHEGHRYLVLEYVEGETLADRLDRGALGVEEAIEVCIGIAAGVEAAHEAGVIHRDLKPANVKITPEGDVKVLDFGLAKADEGSGSSFGVTTESPTITTPHARSPTVEGTVLGTAPYMSPEQARGRRVDKRTDIWSFGAVLYECLTGVGPFVGETATDSIGAILHKEVDLGMLPAATPRSVRAVLERCLERDRNQRLRDIGDARIELERARRGKDLEPPAVSTQAGRSLWGVAGWVIALLATAGAVALGIWGKGTGAAPPIRPLVADIAAPDGLSFATKRGSIALSPDGERLAFIALNKANTPFLCVRDLRSGDVRVVESAEDPYAPFWSPDGGSVGYLRDGLVWTVDLEGGKPEFIGGTSNPEANAGATWNAQGTILFASMRGPLLRLTPGGGSPGVALDPFPDRGGDWPVCPSFLPDGDQFLFMNQDDEGGASGLCIARLSTGEHTRLLASESNAMFASPDRLVYARNGSLYTQRYDAKSTALTGEPVRIASQVWTDVWPVVGLFSVAGDRLAYVPSGSAGDESELVWFDRATGAVESAAKPGSLWNPRISHDGRRIAIDRTVPATSGDIAVIDVARGVESLLSRDASNESVPIWTPDDSEIFFFRGADLYRIRANGTESARLLYSSPGIKLPSDVSPDAGTLLFSEQIDNSDNLLLLDLETGETRPWLSADFNESSGQFSPDGRWVAYVSNASGQEELYVRSFPDGERLVRVSTNGGTWPHWRGDAKELLYLVHNDIMAASIDLDATGGPVVGTPEVVWHVEGLRGYDVTPDGTRLLVVRMLQADRTDVVRLVQGWDAQLE